MKKMRSPGACFAGPGSGGRVRALLVAAGILSALVGPARLAAQSPQAGQEAPAVGCFRGRPLPSCKSFWLVEMQGYAPLVQSTTNMRYSDGSSVPIEWFESTVEWNVGHMINLTPSWAVGGLLSVGPQGGSSIFSGAKLRVRRWISPDWSVELQGGLLDSGAAYPSARGVTADVRVNVRDQGAFFVRWDGLSASARAWPGGNYSDPGGFHQAISIGAAAGSVPALIGTGALGLGYMVLLGIFLSNGS